MLSLGWLWRGPRLLATATSDEGTWIASLVGSGGLLAVNSGPPAELDVIGRDLRRIASGGGARNAQVANAGRIAVLSFDGTIRIYSAAGKLLLRMKPTLVGRDEGFNGNAVALSGGDLLVLTRARRLEDYSSYSGARLRSWRVRAGATNLAATEGLAAYAEYPPGPETCCASFKVHVVRLSTGQDVVVGTGAFFTAQRDVVLGPSGLVYLKNRRTLVFIPLSRVWAAVS
jgi:hypothetical protein